MQRKSFSLCAIASLRLCVGRLHEVIDYYKSLLYCFGFFSRLGLPPQ